MRTNLFAFDYLNFTRTHSRSRILFTAHREEILRQSFVNLGLLARARSRIIKVARTIADLDMSENIEVKHILEAVGYRGNYN